MVARISDAALPIETLADDALIAEIAQSNVNALGELYRRYHMDVFRFVSRLGGVDEREREDLVHATFMEIQKAAASFERTAKVKTWLFAIAANVVRHHVRAEVRRRDLHREAGELPPPSARRPDEHVHRRQLVDRIAAAMAELPSDLREVFVACEVEDLPCREVARELGISEGTLWRRLHEARKWLANALRKDVS
ncbi:MAG: RNA polymerase sigma factor [Polyangiaceae bacterium]|nr:RNA polymerase sigma factor [Polyangiaceae bacterium]